METVAKLNMVRCIERENGIKLTDLTVKKTILDID
jgi:hypothetical protein